MATPSPLSPKQAFKENIHPAELLLQVYTLLENDEVLTSGELVTELRAIVKADDDEELLLIYNEVFTGLVREAANVPKSTLRKAKLENLLRQAVVAACTGLDTYLPSVLRAHLPDVIRAKGRAFFPQDTQLREFFSDLQFDLATTLRLLGDPDGAPLFIANKILGLTSFKYLSNKKGVHAVGALLGIEKPWDAIAEHLGRDKRQLMSLLTQTTDRRNDIVHRADRPQSDPGGEIQSIGFIWARQAVDTVKHVCLGLDELIVDEMGRLNTQGAEPATAEAA